MADKGPGVDFPGGDAAPGGGHVWGRGEGPLALVTGLVVGVLSRDRQWAVEMPGGYAPEFELVMRDGRRFRVRLEEVSRGGAVPGGVKGGTRGSGRS